MGHEDFIDGCHCGHLGYRIRTISAIKNRHVDPMAPIKFQLNLTFRSGDVVWSISRWPPLWSSLISEQNYFSDLNLHVTLIPPFKFKLNFSLSIQEKVLFEDFKMAAIGHEDFIDGCHGGHLGFRNGTILAIKNCHVNPMPPIVSAQSDFPFGRRCRLKIFKISAMSATLDIGTEQF